MRLVCPKDMTNAQERGLRLCLERSAVSLTKDEIDALLTEQIETIEAGVHFIDKKLPIPGAGVIDKVAVDGARRALLVNVAGMLTARLLCEVFARTDWAEANFKVLEHIAGGERLRGLRVWVLVEAVAPDAYSIAKRMRPEGLDIFECRRVDLAGEMWIVVRKMDFDSRRTDWDRDDGVGSALNHGGNFKLDSVLTKEEVADFFDGNRLFDSAEEVTSRIQMF